MDRRRWLECAPALAALAWLAVIGWWDGRSEERPPLRRSWTFSLREAQSAVLQSVGGREAAIRKDGPAGTIILSARPCLLATHFHGAEPEGHEKPAEQWGFTWALQRMGPKLIIRALGEVREAPYQYLLDDLEVRVPEGFDLELESPP